MSARVVHVNDNVPGAIYIGRSNLRKGLEGSPFANPYPIGKKWGNRQNVVRLYREWAKVAIEPSALIDLLDKPLACWCRHDGQAKTEENMCHGDVLIEMIDQYLSGQSA